MKVSWLAACLAASPPACMPGLPCLPCLHVSYLEDGGPAASARPLCCLGHGWPFPPWSSFSLPPGGRCRADCSVRILAGLEMALPLDGGRRAPCPGISVPLFTLPGLESLRSRSEEALRIELSW